MCNISDHNKTIKPKKKPRPGCKIKFSSYCAIDVGHMDCIMSELSGALLPTFVNVMGSVSMIKKLSTSSH